MNVNNTYKVDIYVSICYNPFSKAMISKEELGIKIRQLRIAKGKSQEELGAALNRSHAAVSDIERGKTGLTVQNLFTISQFLDVPVTEFLTPEERNISMHGAFSQNRDSKDIKPAEKEMADKMAEDIFKLVKAKIQEEEK